MQQRKSKKIFIYFFLLLEVGSINNINVNKLNEVMSLSLKAHKTIGCNGVTRSDFKFYENKFYLLEINTQPGMTKLSLVPEIAKYNGISFIKLIEWILKDATTKK